MWKTLAPRIESRIYGPHLEHIAREWVMTHASEETLGGLPTAVGPSVIGDPSRGAELEIDVVATAGDRVLALGEVKWSAPAASSAVSSLERKRTLLGPRAATAKLLLFAPTFPAPRHERPDVELISFDRLYRGR